MQFVCDMRVLRYTNLYPILCLPQNLSMAAYKNRQAACLDNFSELLPSLLFRNLRDSTGERRRCGRAVLDLPRLFR